jgi:hypothetical protein
VPAMSRIHESMRARNHRPHPLASVAIAAVIGVHHHGKERSRGPVGSFAFTAAADFILTVFREANESGGVNHRWIALTKSRREETGWSCDFGLKRVMVGLYPDGEEVYSSYVEPLPDTAGPDRKFRQPVREGKPLATLKKAASSAIEDFGQMRPVGNNGHLVQAVELHRVQENFNRLYESKSGDPRKRAEAARRAFRRGLDDASAGTVMTCRQGEIEWLWLPGGSGEQTGMDVGEMRGDRQESPLLPGLDAGASARPGFRSG